MSVSVAAIPNAGINSQLIYLISKLLVSEHLDNPIISACEWYSGISYLILPRLLVLFAEMSMVS